MKGVNDNRFLKNLFFIHSDHLREKKGGIEKKIVI